MDAPTAGAARRAADALLDTRDTLIPMDKTLRQLIRDAERAGWSIVDRGESVLFYSPDGETIVTVHKSESDYRALKNTVARLRRAGLKVA